MKTNKVLMTLAILAACLSTSPQSTWAQADGHEHSTGETLLKLDNGIKWATDANLRLGMSRIRDALSGDVAGGKLSAIQYRTLAQKVNDQISFIVQNCKLGKEADEMLHLILAELVAGADAISASGDEHSMHHGAEKISHALKDYATFFEHPGWIAKSMR
jgi:hypothetical protein